MVAVCQSRGCQFGWMVWLVLGLLVTSLRAQSVLERGREGYGIGRPQRLEDLGDEPFIRRLRQLPPAAQERAVTWMQSFEFHPHDLRSLVVDENGGVCYACHFEVPDLSLHAEQESANAADPVAVPKTALSEAMTVDPLHPDLLFHSRPGAPNVLYLNFVGDLITGTEWNRVVGRQEIPALPFSTDADYDHFNESEATMIRRIWQRVAEDYAPFNVDVTTERPATMNSRVAVALITGRRDANGDPNPNSTVAGVAYVNVFGTTSFSRYRPAWIYHDNLHNVESFIAEAGSHEVGHNMGLSHDGRTDDQEYYGGHGGGEISWGPIMGTGYNRNVTQWSRGEYYLANNTQDDLAILAAKMSFRPDDHGNTAGTATPLVVSSGYRIESTTPANDPQNQHPQNKGILERNTDVDVFSFVTGDGPIQLTVQPWVMTSGTRGGNLHVAVEVYNDRGVLVGSQTRPDRTSVDLGLELEQGRYFLHVRNAGTGDPFASSPFGYTAYGSLGQYFIRGQLTEPTEFIIPPVAEFTSVELNRGGVELFEFSVVYSDDDGILISSLSTGNLRVSGPNGYEQPAELVRVDVNSNGSPRRAIYGIRPGHGGPWQLSDNGIYTVFMVSEQVSNLAGAYVPEGELGVLSIAVPQILYSATMEQDPGWDLEPQWQYGVPDYRTAGPAAGVLGPRIVGYNLSGNYANNLSPRHATTPPIDTTGATALTLRFRRWLRIRPNDPAFIEVSANGAEWISIWRRTTTLTDTGWTEVQYPLPSSVLGGTALQIRWGISSNPALNDIGWNIDAVELLADGLMDAEPPTAELFVADLTLGGSPSHPCSVLYRDATGVRLETLNAANLRVVGPGDQVLEVDYVGADLAGDGSPVTATYSIIAPNETWQTADNGTYHITWVEGSVEDVLNNTNPEMYLGAFEVLIPTGVATLQVTPTDVVHSSGIVGGAVQPDSQIYTLNNPGATPLNWTVDSDVDWLIAEPTSGELDAATSGTVVVRLGPLHAELTAGAHSGILTFRGESDAEPSVREWILVLTEATRWTDTRLQEDGGFMATLVGSPQSWYQIEGSSDLVDWQVLKSVQVDELGVVLISIPEGTHAGYQFFRAQLLEAQTDE